MVVKETIYRKSPLKKLPEVPVLKRISNNNKNQKAGHTSHYGYF